MTDSTQQCPSGLRQHDYDNRSSIRACVTNNSMVQYGCNSTVFPVNIPYSEVCGRVTGYQIGITNAFSNLSVASMSRRGNHAIDDIYVDGVSLTYGDPRQHIWTFAAALDREGTKNSQSRCPCESTSAAPPPEFVLSHYFCDTGTDSHVKYAFFYPEKLWDGENCTSSDPCCSFNSPPWFHRVLPQPTAEDIEMRVCRDEGFTNEDIAIERIELYVQ